MTQLKVYEFAKEIGIETLALMDQIKEWKLPIKSHMATLDEEMIAEIRARLDQAKEAKVGGLKKTKKKAVRKKTVAKKKTTEVKASSSAVTKKVARKASPAVIRRKAGEADAKLQEAQEEAQAAAAQRIAEAAAPQAIFTPEEEVSVSQASAAPTASDEVSEGPALDASAPAGTAEEPARKVRRNIVGRMDLRRVASIPAAGSGAASPRVSRSAPRNIRPGFFSEPTMPSIEDHERHLKEQREKEEARLKKARPGAGGGREEEPQTFTATEFRKREVIFQPKKKKPVVGRIDSKKTQITTPAAHKRVVRVHGAISVSALAMEMGIKAGQLMKKLIGEGITATMNTELDFDTVSLVVPEFGWEAQNVQRSVEELVQEGRFGSTEAELVTRPPVVTVMGHVDHGKTTLLDTIRKARVAAKEAGGITQHIGAYSVKVDKEHDITFIDTPGHAAFTAMRARGANVTDIAIIVVAADDGVMPQTAEAINHAKAAGVPIVVAVNKMDRPGANPDRIKQQLTEYELVPEEWGGTTIFCPISALKGDGIKELLEQLVLVAEVQELKANPKMSATGVVIESRMEKGRGSVASVLVQNGTLEIGQIIVAGSVFGRIRSMMDDQGKQTKKVGPGYSVEILGLPEPPMAGDSFDVVKDESIARQIVDVRKSAFAQEETPSSKLTLEQLFSKVKTGDVKELSIILKSDVAGSQEAVKSMIEKLGNEEVKVKVIHSAIGGITESDVLLASTAKGLIIGFNVRPDTSAARLAKEKGVEIKTYSIIYELSDDLKKALSGLLSPDVVEKVQGRAEVRNIFVVPKVGTIAGCSVVDGKIARNHQARLIRNGVIVFEGTLGSLKRFKDDVREVASGFECGISIENFNDIKVGDNIETFTKEEVVREL